MLERGNTLFVGAAPPRGTIPGKNCTSFGPQLWRILAAMRFREDHRSGWYDRSYHPDSGRSMSSFLLQPKLNTTLVASPMIRDHHAKHDDRSYGA